jgi:uncharacterized protein (DUF305 family)
MSKIRYALALTAAVAAAVTLAACSSNTGSGSMGGMNHSAATAAPGSNTGPHNAQDTVFTQTMIVHHTGAIEMADLAATRASSTKVKTLASQIKAAQQPEIKEMTSWLKAWGELVTMPGMTSPSPMPTASDMSGMDMSTPSPSPSASGMGSAMPGMTPEDMATLSSATGPTFDKEFLTLMIEHHQSAVSMAKDELSKGQNTAAKNLAQSIVTSQTKQITSMKTTLSSLG